ncbi:hypothetical protein M427DRAFT_384424 [Gonapodya prolifera JEL478]|uniref:Uncharacterized protein n=1 Tax=Gonapodya prolifera (strain JEL478) TaxID=1344416 RepID=A0A139A8J2_GONPJ|nr:hypothetical protein M427DRAFT_384424 [Gonapodya prolifera JEL478]|eukprot:KXS13019.1 hypothetical protein M427DRAFT_384424 [Gonapodya prolifera JEL478]
MDSSAQTDLPVVLRAHVNSTMVGVELRGVEDDLDKVESMRAVLHQATMFPERTHPWNNSLGFECRATLSITKGHLFKADCGHLFCSAPTCSAILTCPLQTCRRAIHTRKPVISYNDPDDYQ